MLLAQNWLSLKRLLRCLCACACYGPVVYGLSGRPHASYLERTRNKINSWAAWSSLRHLCKCPQCKNKYCVIILGLSKAKCCVIAKTRGSEVVFLPTSPSRNLALFHSYHCNCVCNYSRLTVRTFWLMIVLILQIVN